MMKNKIPKGDAGSGFKLWEYRVSHSQLLIRCPKLSASSKNIDVKFYNVEYVDLPSLFQEIAIDEPSQEEILFASRRLGRQVESQRVIVVRNGDQRHIVVAGAVVVSENSMEIFESPFALPPVEL
jgi:hypothetical protein